MVELVNKANDKNLESENIYVTDNEKKYDDKQIHKIIADQRTYNTQQHVARDGAYLTPHDGDKSNNSDHAQAVKNERNNM